MRLLVLLLGWLVLSPLLEEFLKLRLLEGLFFTAIFIYAAYSFSRNKALVAAAVSSGRAGDCIVLAQTLL